MSLPLPSRIRGPHLPAIAVALLLVVGLPAAALSQAPQEDTPAGVDLSALQWRNVGPGGVGGRIVDFAVVPDDPDVIYVGTAYGGAWKSVDGGITWEPVFEKQERTPIGGIAVAPSNPNVVWIGTGEANGRNLVSTSWGNGVYKSEDGGETWTHVGLDGSQQIGRVRVHPDNPDWVLVSVLGSLKQDDPELDAMRGLWGTHDGGETWEKLLSAGDDGGFTDVDFDPRDPRRVYAASWERRRVDWSWYATGDESGLFRSDDGGKTWERITNGIPQGDDVGRIGVSVCTGRPDTLYAVIAGPEGGVFRSDDRGASWQRRTEEVKTSQYYGQVRCDPNDPERVYVLGTRFWVSHDGGRTFTNEMRDKDVHVDHHALWIDPRDSEHLLLGNDGGVYVSRDRGDSWRFVSNLPITQFYEIGVDLQEPWYRVYGGTQDNNTVGGPTGTRNAAGIVNDDWFLTVGGDGFYARPDPSDPTIVYSESPFGNLVRFDTRTGERKFLKPSDPPPMEGDGDGATGAAEASDEGRIERYRWNWSAPLLISPHDAATIYFGAQVVFRSPDRGDTWEVISPDLTRNLEYDSPMNDYSTTRVIEESPLRRGLLAVGTDDGLVQISADDGATWRAAAAMPGVPEITLIRRIVLSAHDPETIYVVPSAHEFNDFRPWVMRSRDLGRTWEDITANLPDGSPLRAFAEHPDAPGLLFAGSEHSVWVSFDDGGSWVSLKNDLPTVATHDMLVHPRANDLLIGTHGRGIWVLDQIGALEEMARGDLDAGIHVFSPRPALLVHRFDRGRGSQGDAYYHAPNPPDGAILDLWIPEEILSPPDDPEEDPGDEAAATDDEEPSEREGDAEQERPEVTLTVRDGQGRRVRRLQVAAEPGLQRVIWDLRHDLLWRAPESAEDLEDVPAPEVLAGTYEVELRVGERRSVASVEVIPDPAVRATEGARRAWHDARLRAGRLVATARAAHLEARRLTTDLDHAAVALEGADAPRKELATEVDETRETLQALVEDLQQVDRTLSRLGWRLAGAVSPPTADQEQTAKRQADELAGLLEQLRTLREERLPELRQALDAAGIPWSSGRPVRMPGVDDQL